MSQFLKNSTSVDFNDKFTVVYYASEIQGRGELGEGIFHELN